MCRSSNEKAQYLETPVEAVKFPQSQHPPTSSTAPFFFFHFDNPMLTERSIYKDERVFMRSSSIEEITDTWESARHELTQEFKRKHKSASRKRAKMGRDGTGGSGRRVDM